MRTTITQSSTTSRNPGCRLCDGEPIFSKKHALCKRCRDSIAQWARRHNVEFSKAVALRVNGHKPKQGRPRVEYFHWRPDKERHVKTKGHRYYSSQIPQPLKSGWDNTVSKALSETAYWNKKGKLSGVPKHWEERFDPQGKKLPNRPKTIPRWCRGACKKFDWHPHSWGDWAPLPDWTKDPTRRAHLRALPTAGVLAPLRHLPVEANPTLCWPQIQRWNVQTEHEVVERPPTRGRSEIVPYYERQPDRWKTTPTASAPKARYVYASRWGDPADRRTRS